MPIPLRPSRDMVLMETARVWESRSTCARNRVGTVIALDGRIIATGYNGAPAGMVHCNHTCPCDPANWTFDMSNDVTETIVHTDECPLKPCMRAVHAEANAIAFSAQNGTATRGGTLYTTLSPCYPCAQLIINAGLRRVVFDRLYRDPAGIDLLAHAGIETATPKRGSRR